MKAADGKLIHGLRLEVQGTKFTALVYAKAGDPRGGDHRLIGRPFSLQEVGGKRIIQNEGEDVPAFTYQFDGERLTLVLEEFMSARIGTDWNVPAKNTLTKLSHKK
jgi:hypothetical protein